ncbi:hypothetical protein CDD81_5237 [Ophiocordyceps australis]|uniref:Protein BZZ1 n=1 Tax=Ophiocordyceps australis TaxID=1399860 RepID=A0A2C5YBK9_9HYPO|nr:hypothetical protein CDD81_5237 [Ophiocordyceps australis]
MAEVEAVPTFGSELKDGFKPACAWVGHGIAWLDDMQQYYRDRSAIEKEYSGRLSALAKKYFDKKNKRSAQLSVGDSPAMTPGSLESASLNTWAAQLTTLESRAAEHDRFATSLVSDVAEPLKQIAVRFDELRKRHADHADRLAADRDASYADLRKVKAKYDATCQEVETRRKKTESHSDKAKAQSAYQQQIFDMNNAKNTYLIAINVTNRLKAAYYHQHLPELMDSLQDLAEFRVMRLNGLWSTATALESDMLRQSLALTDKLGSDIKRNEPQLDSAMYMHHNMAVFNEPADKTFEPSPVWHDDDVMVVDETAKVYLRNVLSKSKAQLGELRREVDKKRREAQGVTRTKQRVRHGAEKDKDEVEVMRTLFTMQEELHAADRRRLTAEVETSTITSAVGDVTLGAKNHNFKGQTFKIPTNCDLCGERIWGLSAKGFDCRDCGYTCHNKCEMKVPADCPGEQSKEERKKLKAQRQETANRLLVVADPGAPPAHVAELPDLTRSNTMTSLSSHSARRSASGSLSMTPATTDEGPTEVPPRTSMSSATGTAPRRRVMAPPPAAYVGEMPGSGINGSKAGADEDRKRGKMLYPFESSNTGELSLPEGRDVVILEPDDGGWTKVRAGSREGLVPTAYVQVLSAPRPSSTYSNSTASSTTTAPAARRKGPAVAPKRGARKLRYVEALYAYEARGAAEHSMAEGERFVLVRDDPGDGWVEVEKAGVTANVPAAYVQTL